MMMPLAIIACVMMEDGVAYVVNTDEDVHKYVADNDVSDGIYEKLNKDKKIVELSKLGKVEDGSIIVDMQPMALHESPDTLRDTIAR